MSTDNRGEAVSRHRDTLEKLASSDVDLQLVDDARALLDDIEEEEEQQHGGNSR